MPKNVAFDVVDVESLSPSIMNYLVAFRSRRGDEFLDAKTPQEWAEARGESLHTNVEEFIKYVENDTGRPEVQMYKFITEHSREVIERAMDFHIRHDSKDNNWASRREMRRIYIIHLDEGPIEEAAALRVRPYKEYRHVLLKYPKIIRMLNGLDISGFANWDQTAGCACGCHPGFTVDNYKLPEMTRIYVKSGITIRPSQQGRYDSRLSVASQMAIAGADPLACVRGWNSIGRRDNWKNHGFSQVTTDAQKDAFRFW